MRLIERRQFPVKHYVLIDESGVLPAEELIAEARRQAEGLAMLATGHRNHFTLIHNGAGVARISEPHVHIICPGSRAHKALIYMLIAIKNLMPAKTLARSRTMAAWLV